MQSPFPIFILLWSIPFLCTAQADRQPTPPKHEFGISLVGMSHQYSHEFYPDYYFNILNGIRYKRLLGRHAIRLGAEYKVHKSIPLGYGIGEGKYQEGKFNLGYQLSFSDKAIRPYIAVDFLYLISTFTSTYQGGYENLYNGFDLRNHGLGFAPAFGIYFRLAKTLSVSWEGNKEYQWVIQSECVCECERSSNRG